MFNPTLEEFIQFSKKSNIIPLYKEIFTDCDTPVSTFYKLGLNQEYSFLLESVEESERWGRYSFISWAPKLIFTSKNNRFELRKNNKEIVKAGFSNNPLIELKKIFSEYIPANLEGLPLFWGGAVGYIGYEMVHCFENIPENKNDFLKLNDAVFLFTDTMIIFDHFTHKTKIVSNIEIEKNISRSQLKKKYVNACKKIDSIISELSKKGKIPVANLSYPDIDKSKNVRIESNIKKSEFIKKVKKAKEYIRAGDIIQVVLSQRFERYTTAKPFTIYRTLRTINPSPYMYYLNINGFQLIGSSPEILVRLEGKNAETRPIAGTRPRGKTEQEEKQYEKELLASPKEKAEHIMLVDLGRNDIGKVCKFSTVRVPELMNIERYSHVIHLVSSVIGELKNNSDAFDLFEACFPAGTVTGAPKIRAMEIISELEPSCRGPYAGAVGYFSYSGSMDMAINIRTILYKKNKAYVQAGAGIVADSNPEREFQETKNKAKALFSAIELAENYENTCNR
ncbi:MAG: anthranilate synthase component I [Endomicrobiia bacterium]